jgi:hypothetical protein
MLLAVMHSQDQVMFGPGPPCADETCDDTCVSDQHQTCATCTTDYVALVHVEPCCFTLQVADTIQLSSRQIEQLRVAWDGYCRSMSHVAVQQKAIKEAVEAATVADAAVLGPVTALQLAAVDQVQKVRGFVRSATATA